MNIAMEATFGQNGNSECVRRTVVVAGFGSPHGDDQAGWRVVALLGHRPGLPARLVKITEGTKLIHELDGCRRLIVVDACRAGGLIGTITRLEWRDPRIGQYHSHSTHGLGVCSALDLADRLGRLPPNVRIYGIEIGSQRPLDEVRIEVAQAVAELTGIIAAEINEPVHARTVAG
jgi:hydrogenase maturation protease